MQINYYYKEFGYLVFEIFLMKHPIYLIEADVLIQGAEPLVEYFVPRSVSEFDLSVASGDTPIGSNFLPLTVRIPRKMFPKQKEKVVTFEDEMASRLAKNNPDLQDVFM